MSTRAAEGGRSRPVKANAAGVAPGPTATPAITAPTNRRIATPHPRRPTFPPHANSPNRQKPTTKEDAPGTASAPHPRRVRYARYAIAVPTSQRVAIAAPTSQRVAIAPVASVPAGCMPHAKCKKAAEAAKLRGRGERGGGPAAWPEMATGRVVLPPLFLTRDSPIVHTHFTYNFNH